jgi:hypothetical protein
MKFPDRLARAEKAVLLAGALEAGRARAVRRRHKAAAPTIPTPMKTAKKSQPSAPARSGRRGAR